MYNNFNPYYQPMYRQNDMNYQTMQQNVQPMAQMPIQMNKSILQGKIVDNAEVVKAMEIPMDGTISYFPIADGSSIVSKQLLNNGSSKIVIYKPVDDTKEEIKTITNEDIEEYLKELKDDLKDIKNQIKENKNKKASD